MEPEQEENLEEQPDTIEVVSDQTTVLLNLEDLIKNNIESIEKLTDELKKHRQMFSDAFENSETYRDLDKKVKEATKAKTSTREQILNQPQMQQLKVKIREMNSDLKDKKFSLSDYLLEYQRLANSSEIQGHDGEVRDIVNTAKVVKRSSKEKKSK